TGNGGVIERAVSDTDRERRWWGRRGTHGRGQETAQCDSPTDYDECRQSRIFRYPVLRTLGGLRHIDSRDFTPEARKLLVHLAPRCFRRLGGVSRVPLICSLRPGRPIISGCPLCFSRILRFHVATS